MNTIPDELKDWFKTLISPPDAEAFIISNLESVDLASWPDESHVGLIVRGTPTEAQSKELLRVLKPGGHLILIAPDTEPTGHTGTCRIEDAGFEIRDSVLLVDSPEGFYYVPKASRAEREAGCSNIAPKQRDEARKEGNPGGVHSVRNFHPTIKPSALMEKLLGDGKNGDSPILDPFMGSGSTGIACVKTGHDFVGIDMEPDYVGIATARIRYWDGETGLVERSVTTEQEPELEKTDSLNDIFGW
jgi:site-specific DNA-methyltransferase (adenine-specific)